MVFLL